MSSLRQVFRLAIHSLTNVNIATAAKSKRQALRFDTLEARENPVSLMVSPTWFAHTATSASTATATADNTREYIVQLKDNALVTANTVAKSQAVFQATPKLKVVEGLGLPGQLLVRTTLSDATARQLLARNNKVASIVPNRLIHASFTNDLQSANTWGLHNTGQTVNGQAGISDADIDLPEAWARSQFNSKPVVAVIDTGVDYNHPDLKNNMWRNPGEIAGNGIDDDANGFKDDVYGFNFINESGDPFDDHSHGTHVAGTIAAEANNGLGVAGVTNNSAQIMALKFLDASGSGRLSDAIEAINYATMMRTRFNVNVRVMNNSWSGGGYSAQMEQAIRASAAADILFVAAASNSASNNDILPAYPANYNVPNVVSVAASDNRDQLASFSNYGSNTVHLAAPGVSILSTTPNGNYAYFSGTSMAAPHVAGVAALAWANSPLSTSVQIKQAILAGVDKPTSLNGYTITGGRLNADRTLSLLVPPTDPMFSGTQGNDTVIIRDANAGSCYEVVINGQVAGTGLWSSIQSMKVMALGGNDYVVIQSMAYAQAGVAIRIEGGDGDDNLDGNIGNDTIVGGAGNDLVYGRAGNDRIEGWDGDDKLHGMEGNDTIWGSTGNDELTGLTGNDFLYGEDGNDTIWAGAGNDLVAGGAGNDGMAGEEGIDELLGEAGDDQFTGGAGDDRLFGGDGNDTLYGFAGNDRLEGEAGNDSMNGDGDGIADGNDILFGQDGNDYLVGHGGNDELQGGYGSDSLDGGSGDDALLGQDGEDNLDAGIGNDTLIGGAANDTLYGREGNDRLEGWDGDDKLHGMEGNDTIWGSTGNDELTGGSGNDFLYGEDGNDTIWAGAGNDLVAGGAGNDGMAGEEGIDELLGEAGDDQFTGGAGDDRLFGGDGNDTLWGFAGNDRLEGGAGDDTLAGDGDGIADGNDVLLGQAGNDYLVGHGGTDSLQGGNGSDTLDGGSGDNTLLD